MTTNKWLSDLRMLKTNTDTLRGHLRDSKVSASDSDTLQTLIGKVPSLAPIENNSDAWQPDALWKFPDPNGRGELKTIKEIFDEDTMASTYTYRGIYQIIGEYDTFDLKSQTGNRTNADTFILSDGTVYTDITTTTLEHTWDKSKDVIDSTGRKMRYVKIYSNVAHNYVPGFINTTIWAIHKLGTSVGYINTPTTTNYKYASTFAPIECLETYGINRTPVMHNLRKLILHTDKIGTVSPGTTYGYQYHCQLKEIELPEVTIYAPSGISNSYFILNAYIDRFTAPAVLTQYDNSGGNMPWFSILDFSKTTNMTSLNAVGSTSYRLIDKIYFGSTASLTTLKLGYTSIKELSIPQTVNTLELKNHYMLEKLVIPSTVTSLALTYMYGLRELVIPNDFALAGINLTYSYYMTKESLVNILENLADLTGLTAKTITFGSVNLSKLTEEEKALATVKNWTLV